MWVKICEPNKEVILVNMDQFIFVAPDGRGVTMHRADGRVYCFDVPYKLIEQAIEEREAKKEEPNYAYEHLRKFGWSDNEASTFCGNTEEESEEEFEEEDADKYLLAKMLRDETISSVEYGRMKICAMDFPYRKKKALGIYDDETNTFYKVATFNNEESAQDFMKYLAKFCETLFHGKRRT